MQTGTSKASTGPGANNLDGYPGRRPAWKAGYSPDYRTQGPVGDLPRPPTTPGVHPVLAGAAGPKYGRLGKQGILLATGQ